MSDHQKRLLISGFLRKECFLDHDRGYVHETFTIFLYVGAITIKRQHTHEESTFSWGAFFVKVGCKTAAKMALNAIAPGASSAVDFADASYSFYQGDYIGGVICAGIGVWDFFTAGSGSAAKEAYKEYSEETAKNVGKHAGKSVAKNAGKAVGKSAAKNAGKAAGKTAAKAAAKGAAKEAAKSSGKEATQNAWRELGGDSLRQFGGDSLRDFGGDSFREFGGNSFRDFGGDSLREFGGNSFRDFGGDSLREFGGNSFREFSGNSFREFGGNSFRDFGGDSLREFGGNSFREFGQQGVRKGARIAAEILAVTTFYASLLVAYGVLKEGTTNISKEMLQNALKEARSPFVKQLIKQARRDLYGNHERDDSDVQQSTCNLVEDENVMAMASMQLM